MSSKCTVCRKTDCLCGPSPPSTKMFRSTMPTDVTQMYRKTELSYPKEIRQMEEMGYSRPAAVHSLLKFDGNINRAIEYLLMNSGDPDLRAAPKLDAPPQTSPEYRSRNRKKASGKAKKKDKKRSKKKKNDGNSSSSSGSGGKNNRDNYNKDGDPRRGLDSDEVHAGMLVDVKTKAGWVRGEINRVDRSAADEVARVFVNYSGKSVWIEATSKYLAHRGDFTGADSDSDDGGNGHNRSSDAGGGHRVQEHAYNDEEHDGVRLPEDDYQQRTSKYKKRGMHSTLPSSLAASAASSGNSGGGGGGAVSGSPGRPGSATTARGTVVDDLSPATATADGGGEKQSSGKKEIYAYKPRIDDDDDDVNGEDDDDDAEALAAAKAGARGRHGGSQHNRSSMSKVERRRARAERKKAIRKQEHDELIKSLCAGMFVDVRDTLGKWLEAEIVDRRESEEHGPMVYVHYIQWPKKWDEWIPLRTEHYRFADFHKFSHKGEPLFKKGEYVYVCPPKLPDPVWVPGEITRVDGHQVQVRYEFKTRRAQYWFHDRSDEITAEDQRKVHSDSDVSDYDSADDEAESAVPGGDSGAGGAGSGGADQGGVVDERAHAGSDGAGLAGRSGGNDRAAGAVRKAVAGRYDDQIDSDGEDASDDTWWVGQYIEVLDTINKWLPAQVLKVRPGFIKVNYEGWSSRWDEWLSLEKDKNRIKPLGVDIEDTALIKKRKLEEKRFREQMLKIRGMTIYEMAGDGNCLFRSVAHQIYNDPERHLEVRKMCYDYMERDRDFFSMYIAEDFDTYVMRQRQPMEWGDHVELVAMRELFNKNVELYDKDSIETPQSLDFPTDDRVPIMRLSFHGGSHYNSVVLPSAPPPLGDGKDAPVSFREQRLKLSAPANNEDGKSDKADDSEAKQQQSSSYNEQQQPPPGSPAKTRGKRAVSRGLFRRVNDVASEDVSDDLVAAWTYYDELESGYLSVKKLQKLVTRYYKNVYQRKKEALRKAPNVDVETLDKMYHDGRSQTAKWATELENKLRAKNMISRGAVSFQHVQRAFGETAHKVEWALSP